MNVSGGRIVTQSFLMRILRNIDFPEISLFFLRVRARKVILGSVVTIGSFCGQVYSDSFTL